MAKKIGATTDRIAQLRQSYQGKGNAALAASTFVSHAPWDVAVQHAQGKATAEFDIKKVFSDIDLLIEDVFEKGDLVLVKWRLRGTWSGAVPFAPKAKPSGDRIELSGTDIYRYSGSQIVDKHSQLDLAASARGLACAVSECEKLTWPIALASVNGL
jgi:hypothetical protein